MTQSMMADWSEMGEDEGCCLNCSDAHEGCLCFNCKCTHCYWYAHPGENDNENGFCELADHWKKRAEEWEDIKDEFAAKDRFLLFCPQCQKNRFMEILKNDDFADRYCFSCHQYFTEDYCKGAKING